MQSICGEPDHLERISGFDPALGYDPQCVLNALMLPMFIETASDFDMLGQGIGYRLSGGFEVRAARLELNYSRSRHCAA
jgi:hypothetical protein